MAPAAATPGTADGPKLAAHLCLRPSGFPPDYRIKCREHALTLGFTQPPDTFGIVLHRFANDLALRLVGAVGRLAKPRHGRVIEREGDLDHTHTILPYRLGPRLQACRVCNLSRISNVMGV
jgi:hypothetical protein